jgi:hypothetical protein
LHPSVENITRRFLARIAKDKLELGPLDKDAELRRANFRWHQHGTILEGNSIGPHHKNGIKREARGLENQHVS